MARAMLPLPMNAVFPMLTPPLRTHLAGAQHQVLVARYLLKAERAAGVELLRRDAELRAEAELEAVREARGGVPVHDGGVHVAQEVVGVRLVGRDYALRMLGAVAVYVLDGGLDVGDDLDGHGEAEIFVRPVGLGGRYHALGVLRRGLVAVELHVLVRERLQKRLEVLLSPVLLHQQGLGGVADAGALGLGVYDYGLGHRVCDGANG